MSMDLVQEVVENIKEQIEDLLTQKDSATDFERGMLLAYADALGIIKGAFLGYDLKKLGLDFDIDSKYL